MFYRWAYFSITFVTTVRVYRIQRKGQNCTGSACEMLACKEEVVGVSVLI